MKERTLKVIVVLQAVLLLILIVREAYEYRQEQKLEEQFSQGLLAKRVYAGIVPPKSYLVTNFDPLEQSLRVYLDEKNINASIYVENLNNGANFGINARSGAFPASLNKVPMAIAILKEVESGKLEMDQVVGSNGETVDQLLQKMLVQSDNEAFNVFSKIVDFNDVNHILQYNSVDLFGSFTVPKEGGNASLVNSKDVSNIFTSLYLSTVLQPQHSEYILELLANSTFDMTKAANLPESTIVAHKYGEYYVDGVELFHDCGIIYEGNVRLLYCIMTRDLPREDALRVIPSIVNGVYTYTADLNTKFEPYRDVE